MSSRNNGSRIFMTELMFSILFFIIVSAICVQCFAGSFKKSRQAKEITQAVNLATNHAEAFLSENGYEDSTEYYDKNWHATDDAMAAFKVTSIVVEPEEKGKCQSVHVVVSTMEDQEIYSLVVEKALKK